MINLFGRYEALGEASKQSSRSAHHAFIERHSSTFDSITNYELVVVSLSSFDFQTGH